MGRKKIVHCKRCGKYSEHLSRRKLCFDYGMNAVLQSISDLKHKTGYNYEKWLAGMKKALAREESQ